MRATIRPLAGLLCGTLLAITPLVRAELRIFACEPEWAALAEQLGGDAVDATSATTGRQDPHRIEPRPSLIAKARRADLVVCTGAGLEDGWLPLLLRQAGNAAVQPGHPGHFVASDQVQRLEIPEKLDRSLGDLHPLGNPHVHGDPRNLLPIADALAARLAELDPENRAAYEERRAEFAARWRTALVRWRDQSATLRGTRIVVHHRSWVYLEEWLGLEEVAALEPAPGLPPTSGHLAEVLDELGRRRAALIVRAAYEDPRPSRWLAERAGIADVALPFTVGGTDGAGDLFALYDETLRLLLEAVR